MEQGQLTGAPTAVQGDAKLTDKEWQGIITAAAAQSASDTAAGAQKPNKPELDAAPLPATDELPPLPEPLLETNGDVFGHENVQGYTADQMREYAIASLRERLSAPSQQQPQASRLPPEFVMVPREPTQEMLDAGGYVDGQPDRMTRAIWREMLEAAPSVTPAAPQSGETEA